MAAGTHPLLDMAGMTKAGECGLGKKTERIQLKFRRKKAAAEN